MKKQHDLGKRTLDKLGVGKHSARQHGARKHSVAKLLAPLFLSAVCLSACTINAGDLAEEKKKQSSQDAGTAVESQHGAENPDANGAGQGNGARAPHPALSPAETNEFLTMLADKVLIPGGEIAIATSEGIGHAGAVAMPAWSTIKVPLAIAALRANPAALKNVQPAIQASSNADAQALWDSLGQPATAGKKTEQVLSEAGTQVAVNTVVTRPSFTSFGQTQWSTVDQVRFASRLHCIEGSAPVTQAMGQVVAGQRYGLGVIPGAQFKGGWGPDESGRYKVRQFGLLPAKKGYVAVALAAAPANGSYESGQAMLSTMAKSLQQYLDTLEGKNC